MEMKFNLRLIYIYIPTICIEELLTLEIENYMQSIVISILLQTNVSFSSKYNIE